MQRYFVAPEQLSGSQVVLTGDDAHHIGRVMRMEAGDTIIVSDGRDVVAQAVISSVTAGRVEADISVLLPMDSEPVWSVTVAQSLPKGDKMELVIQKGTEIGASAFLPFQSERMIVQYDGKKEAKRLSAGAKSPRKLQSKRIAAEFRQ